MTLTWAEEKILEAVQENPNLSYQQMSDMIGIGVGSVKAISSRMRGRGLSVPYKSKRILSKDNIDNLIDEGKTTPQIAQSLGVSISDLRRFMFNNKIDNSNIHIDTDFGRIIGQTYEKVWAGIPSDAFHGKYYK